MDYKSQVVVAPSLRPPFLQIVPPLFISIVSTEDNRRDEKTTTPARLCATGSGVPIVQAGEVRKVGE